MAAKKGGDKKGGNKKGGGALAGLMQKKAQAEAEEAQSSQRAMSSQYNDPESRLMLFMICDAYWKQTGKPLLQDVDFETLSAALWSAPVAVVTTDRGDEEAEVPAITWANERALEVWDATWDDFVGRPADDQALYPVLAAGTSAAVTKYSGIQQSFKGTKFNLKDASVMNINDPTGDRLGQALIFTQYELEDGTACSTSGPPPAAQPVPTQADLDAANAAVAEQADFVRQLKEGQGLGNQASEVMASVTELKRRKEVATQLKERLERLATFAAGTPQQ